MSWYNRTGDKMKFIKRIVTIIICITMIVFLLFLGIGFVNYKNAIAKTSIEKKVSQIQGGETYVSSEELSPYILEATVAIEDRRFYNHSGIDYWALTRALISNMFAKEIVGGGSTITQQLTKNLYFTYKSSYVRKASELFMAYDFESKLTKDAILELYVNVINYGNNYIGIKEASRGYFNKEPSELTLDEATLLAGIPQSPSNFQLNDHLDNALQRQQQVLEAMVRDEIITDSQANAIIHK